MKIIKNNFTYLLMILLLSVFTSQANVHKNVPLSELRTSFQSPPDSSRPWVYWFWMNGNLSKEGITADLEAMSNVGIGGALIMSVNFRTPAGKYAYLSDEWRDMFHFAIEEADRLNIKVIKNNDAGWTGSGGPWVTPQTSMQQITFSETHVSGAKNIKVNLSLPPNNQGHYEDIAVYAVPSVQPIDDSQLEITTSGNAISGESLNDLKLKVAIELVDKKKVNPQWILFDYKKPVKIQAMTMNAMIKGHGNAEGYLQVSDDNKTFITVKDIYVAHKGDRETVSFEPVKARYFRLALKPSKVQLDVSEVMFHNTPRIEQWDQKSLYVQSDAILPELGDTQTVNDIINVTDKMDAQGKLTVSLPKGDWNIVRIGHTTTGKKNVPPPKAGSGLEVSKLNKDKVEMHFDNLIGKLVKDVGPLAGDTLMGTHIDSWEIKFDTWDNTLPAEFKKRMGYDMMPYLPATVGQIVKSREITERFLWDLRRVMTDVVADNYFGHMQTLAAEKGLKLSAEAYLYGPMDTLQAAGSVDIPMNEFWTTPNGTEKYGYGARQAASAAHTYDKPIVGAEAFTATPQNAAWTNHPYYLKALGDRMFVRGTNRLIFHRWAMQPWTDRWPGMTFGPYGFNFERTLTWFKQSKAWLTYLSRSQYLLQNGQFHADYAVFVGDTAPYNIASIRDEVHVDGYNFDYINNEIIHQLSVENGELVLPSGMRYKMVVLKNSSLMTLRTLNKINELVEQGGVILGDKPTQSPSLVGYPQSDIEMTRLANKLWSSGASNNNFDDKPGSNKVGKGQIHWHKTPSQVLQAINIIPDVAFNKAGKNIEWLHRYTPDADYYYLSLFRAEAKGVQATFRISGRQPEFWDADTGEMIAPATWQANRNGTTTVTFDLDPSGSVFVVFPKTKTTIDPIKSIRPNKRTSLFVDNGAIKAHVYNKGNYQVETQSGKKQQFSVGKLPEVVAIANPWTLSFPKQFSYKDHLPKPQILNQLSSWSENSDKNVRHFSGTGIYTSSFNLPEHQSAEHKTLLDLGDVQQIAEVKVNGVDFGILWKPPFQVDITKALKQGTNQLEVKVTNVWVNRLIGDAAYPDYLKRTADGTVVEWPQWMLNGEEVPKTGRTTFTTYMPYKKNKKLLASGLIGPVRLIPYVERSLDHK
ncbi:MAG: glycosyl hydrolase [Thalassotalea sp.]